ncbi:hypothetical protein HWV62_809 [Athelia sp. TMB]|nr:hypothetical protein HWV62_809 [Athelia sp. TMB]
MRPVANDQGYRTPEDISVTVLGGMEETAKAYLGETVTHAVATAPACELCNDAQRQATRDRYRQPEVEKAQRTLPIQQSTRPKIQSFEDGDDFFAILVPPKFEEISHTMKPVKQALKEANVRRTSKRLSSSLVGGSTRILEVQYLCGRGRRYDATALASECLIPALEINSTLPTMYIYANID